MERISIFNYEAFYLDFLEGNLNEADTLLLMNFLEMNPDLKVELDDELPLFAEENVVLDDFSKLMLKSNVEEAIITSENVDYFIIAESEGLLDEVKSSELSSFISGNVVLEKEKKLAGLVSFQPNAEIAYADKAGLKKKRRIVVLWPYAAAIAAASVVLFFWSVMNSDSPSIESSGSKMSASTNSGNKNTKISPVTATKRSVTDKNGIPTQNNAKNQVSSEENSVDNKESVEKELRVNSMKSNPVGPIASINEQKLAPIGTRYSTPTSTNNHQKEEDVLALSPYTAMHNPIEPITKFVSKQTNTEIEFQTTQKVEDERRGFHLKIGKFEISRNKRR